jgi:phosphopantothenoylcysteine decarboxylase/phosphopantothenate--cysteine ligase
LGIWADAYLIAPATANTIAKMANGVADNLLLTSYLSAKCPIFIAPAMDLDMFKHPATQKNIATLLSYKHNVIEPTSGELASGLDGKGRMEEPENIVKVLKNFFQEKKRLTGKKILVTAGPTYEPIDPVRFIGNYSSGKMGYAIAETLAEMGADVILISGPVSISIANQSIRLIEVQTAQEMYAACMVEFPYTHAAIMSAAVADYTPLHKADKKIKRQGENISIELTTNKDIAAELGKIKKENQLLVGFALETNDEINYATSKLHKKNLDFIVLNSLKDTGAGFRHDTNKISIINKDGSIEHFDLKSKKEVATDICNKLSLLL